MIEMVYSSKESEEQGNVTIPKNIRQIGENNSNQKIYVEDNVITKFKEKNRKTGRCKLWSFTWGNKKKKWKYICFC